MLNCVQVQVLSPAPYRVFLKYPKGAVRTLVFYAYIIPKLLQFQMRS